ncbi:MAG: hypothetical protein WA624_22730 [Methylocella sp.]
MPDIDERFKRRPCGREIIILRAVCIGIAGAQAGRPLSAKIR